MTHKCSVCVNRNKETVIEIKGTYFMCASCVRERMEDNRMKINRLENILDYAITCGL